MVRGRTASGIVWAANAVAVVAVVSVLAYVRLALAGPVLNRVWAEDGSIFLADARATGAASIGHLYAGYGHLVPRLVALGLSTLPLEHYAPAAVLFSCLFTGLAAAVVVFCARRTGLSAGLSLVAGCSLALVPAVSVESLGSLANLQWFMLTAYFWCAMLPPAARGGMARPVVAVTSIVTASSAPLLVLFWPAVLLRDRRRAWRNPAVLWSIPGLAFQVVLEVHQVAPANAAAIHRQPGLRPRLFTELVDQTSPSLHGQVGPGLVFLALALVVAATLWLGRGAPLVVPFVVAAVVLVVVAALINGDLGARYLGTGTTVLVGGVLLAAREVRAEHPRVVRALTATVVVVTVMNFPAPASRVSGPGWAHGAEAVSRACASGQTVPELRWSPADYSRRTRLTC